MEIHRTTLPDVESEDMSSIIRADSSEENSSAFQRYAVPPQFEGNSSEEDEPNVTIEEKDGKSNEEDNTDEPIDDEFPEGGYQALVPDEFGEFVSSEAFGDYYSQEDVNPNFLQSSRPAQDNVNIDQTEELKNSEAIPVIPTPPAVLSTSSQKVSIPPLDADKISLIKAAMAKVSIGQPSFSTAALAEVLERSRPRVGDEITE